VPTALAALPFFAASPEAVFAGLRSRPGAVWLDGGDDEPWSVLAWDPVEVVRDAAAWPDVGRRLTGAAPGDRDLPFVGGVIGLVGYGAGPVVATVPASEPAWEPDVWLGRYEGALLFHHPTSTWHVAGSDRVRREARERLDAAVALPKPAPATRVPLRTGTSARWIAGVRRALDLIGEGDVYQVNLTRAVHAHGVGDPWDAWRRLRATSRPGRGAYLVLDDHVCVLSNSPERLLDVDGDEATTTPIKGTRPRHVDPVVDRALADELEASAKERAELVMIVDLCRNDLGRVAVPGSVSVGPRVVRAHPNVHHASQEVRATLRPGEDAWSALAALFPPGSVVGAPKLRAARRIAELEVGPRGVYCGAIGFASAHGRAAWSVAIRTAVFRDGDARWHVGSGIVADSDPDAEWAETVAKGSLLAAAIAGGREEPGRTDEARPTPD
jgi:para-aminobenzoate synthetase component 1